MSRRTVDLVVDLAGRHPPLEPVLAEHVADNLGDVLPHVFFGDLTRYVVSTFVGAARRDAAHAPAGERSLRALLDLERAYVEGDDDVQELLVVSFLENLPRPGEQGAGVRQWLGPALRAQLRLIG